MVVGIRGGLTESDFAFVRNLDEQHFLFGMALVGSPCNIERMSKMNFLSRPSQFHVWNSLRRTFISIADVVNGISPEQLAVYLLVGGIRDSIKEYKNHPFDPVVFL